MREVDPTTMDTTTKTAAQFSLKALMLCIAVAAAVLTVASRIGYIFAPLLTFIALIDTYLLRLRADKEGIRSQRPNWTWGVIMPVICLSYDPILFSNSHFEGDTNLSGAVISLPRPWMVEMGNSVAADQLPKYGIYPESILWIVGIGIQIAAMSAWLIMGPKLLNHANLFAGLFRVGFLISLGIGIFLLPMTIIGTLLVGAGLPGWTPFLTANVFWEQSKIAREIGGNTSSGRFKTGICIAFLLPICALLFTLAGLALTQR